MPWPVALAIVVALQLVAIWLIPSLRLNNAPEVYYPPGSPAVVLRDALRRDFPSDELLTVVFQGDDLFSLQFLRRLDALATLLAENPLVDRVTSITTMEHISGTADGFAVGRLVDVGRLRKDDPDAVRTRVMADRFAPGLLVSKDGTVTALVVRPKPLSESADRLALKVAVATAINDTGLRRYYAGDAGPLTLDVAQLQSILQDSMFFVPTTTVLGLALLAWVVGRLRPVVIGGLAVATVVHPMIAAIAWSGQPYTMASAILPSLLAAYTFATLLHLYAGVQKAQLAGLNRSECVDRALSETFKPGLYNVLTTGAGLLSLVFVPIPPIQVFGVAGAFGTGLVFLSVFVLVPPFLTRWDNRRWPLRDSAMGHFGRIASRITMFSMRRPKAILLVFGLALVAAAPLLRDVKVESDVLAFFKPDHEVNRYVRLIESKLVGTTTLEISLLGGGRDSLKQIERLAAIRDFQRWLETLPEVDRATSFVDLVEEMNWAMNGEDPKFRDLPSSDRLLSQYLLIYDGDDLREFVNREYERARVVAAINVHGATEIRRVIDLITAHVVAHPIAGVAVDVGGNGRLFADQVDLLVDGQIDSFASAFIQIFLFMALLWRSFTASAICLVPNLAPLYCIFVLMGAASIHLDLATVMIAGVVLGITVDDTIHLYHGYRRRLQEGISAPLAMARAFQSSGRAVIAISLLLTAQFGLLAMSAFVPTSNFGLMTAVGLLAGQAAELLLLPALLILKDGRRHSPAHRLSQSGSLSPRVLRNAVPALTETLWPAEPIAEFEPETRAAAARPAEPDPSGTVAPNALPAASVTPTGAMSYVMVCRGEACRAKGADAIWHQCLEAFVMVKARGEPPTVLPIESPCLRQCEQAPVVRLASNTSALTDADPAAIATRAAELIRSKNDAPHR